MLTGVLDLLILRVLPPTYTYRFFLFERFNSTSTHHVQQYIQHPTHSRTHPPYTTQQYSCTGYCCVVLGLPGFSHPTPTGIELARPREHLFMPAARRCRLLCVFMYNFSLLLCHRSLAGRFLVVSPSLSPLSSPRTLQWWRRGYQGWDDKFLRSPWRPSSC